MSSADTHTEGPAAPSSAHGLAAGAGLTALLAALYLIPARRLGFWEPWETSLATLGRHVATTDASSFAPVRDGVIIARPWLETALLSFGYQVGGGSELGFRLPLALLMICAALTAFVVLRHFFGTLRAFCASALFGVTPVTLLASVNLAGHGAYEAPVVLTIMLAAALIGGWERARLPATVLLGPALAMCFWAGGVLGLSVPLVALAFFCVGARDVNAAPHTVPMLIGGLFGALCVLGGVVMFQQLEWSGSKDVIGVIAALGLPIAMLIAAAPGSYGQRLFHKVYTPIALLLFAMLIWVPFAELLSTVNTLAQASGEQGGVPEALKYVLYNDFLSSRVLPEHVSFDVLIRLVGASAFPTIVLVPFGFAYLFRSLDAPAFETDDPSEAARAIKQLLAFWVIAGMGVFGLGASLAGTYAFPIAFPLTASVALALGDRAFRDMLSRNLIVLYVSGLTALMLLGMTSKDIRGAFDEDSGRPGPHVVFERLLTDGSVEFPTSYTFENIQVFMLLWALVLVLIFTAPVTNVGRIGDALTAFRWPSQGRLRWLSGLNTPTAKVGRLFTTVHGRLAGLWPRQWHVATISAIAFTGAAVTWGAHLSYVDVPDVTDHLSQKGIMDTFDRLNVENGPLHVAGIDSDDNSYYLGEGNIERISRVGEIRTLFCEADTRVFAIIPFDQLAEAHYAVRSVDDRHDCPEGLPFHVVDGRSSRYVLLSNQLRVDEGEQEESVIAANVFTRDTLPDSFEPAREELTLGDETLRFVGYEMIDEIDSGEFMISTYWEVLKRPTVNYEMFIHVDLGGNRLNGDHEPVGGHYPTRYWVPGEIVRDDFEIDVSRADPSGTYHAYIGFFRGDDRLGLDGHGGDNRLLIDTIEVR